MTSVLSVMCSSTMYFTVALDVKRRVVKYPVICFRNKVTMSNTS
jgi:hypothetical protein